MRKMPENTRNNILRRLDQAKQSFVVYTIHFSLIKIHRRGDWTWLKNIILRARVT